MEDTGTLSDKNIVNGKDAKLGMINSIVSLRDQKKRHVCGGTLISKDIVFTAAHCCIHPKVENNKDKKNLLGLCGRPSRRKTEAEKTNCSL